jgi:hypothetical protein
MWAKGSARDTRICVINSVVSIERDCTEVAGVIVMDRLFRRNRCREFSAVFLIIRNSIRDPLRRANSIGWTEYERE